LYVLKEGELCFKNVLWMEGLCVCARG